MDTVKNITIVENATELAEKAAALFAACGREAMDERKVFFAAVSGGSTPRAMHQLLGTRPLLDAISWAGLHLFWVDDRCVPYDDPASNFGAARDDFITRVPLAEEHIHPMPTTMAPEEGAIQYEKALGRIPTASGCPRFDVVFLGIGPDGHTASLFPQQDALEEEKKWVTAVKGGNPHVYRLTLTFPVLNQARHVIFLASGKAKAMVVKAVLEERRNVFPAERIHPVDGRLTWLLDREAASLLSKS